MNDEPPTPFPTGAQVTSFIAKGVSLEAPSHRAVTRAPSVVIYHEMEQPPAPLPPDVRRARMVGEEPEPEPVQKRSPTEEELRAALHQANLARDFLADAERRAAATYERAQRHAAQCRERVESFATLDEDIAKSTIEALCEEHRPRVDVPDELRRKLTERGAARDDLRAAGRAVEVLGEALAAARTEAGKAATAARRAAIRVLSLQADASAIRHDELLVEAAQFRELLAQFDRICAGSGVALPASVRQVLLDPRNEVNLNRVLNAGDWAPALEALLTNAQAGVDTHADSEEEE